MSFTIYPAIDLRGGKVVRLKEGDPARMTSYSDDPAETAKRWLTMGAKWLHVVNLDGAFGEGDGANRKCARFHFEDCKELARTYSSAAGCARWIRCRSFELGCESRCSWARLQWNSPSGCAMRWKTFWCGKNCRWN